ncbi:hypothetical protein FB562_2097 [Homoserinimonas aerilata]|uniref:Uncharacterized protein n=1 Tax=Homoserinimonas aerilata TaxID=1162970 RepID=A0A542YEQ0_9MICO|nr:hypothetical protein [Homoserinimonas aerilata]TQL46573.1 hypothetical protein FB562_2097 [Homoserinimonas aerilata]
MSTLQDPVEKTVAGRPGGVWILDLGRAVPALGAGLAITFMQDHSATVGSLVFGIFALASGVVLAAFGGRALAPGATRTVIIIQGIVTAMLGGAGITFGTGAGVTPGGLSEFLLLLTVFAAITGFLELYAGLRSRDSAIGRDWLTVGGFTAIAALVFLIIPPDPILATGLFGAYAVLVGVYHVIAGLSLRWAQTSTKKGEATA